MRPKRLLAIVLLLLTAALLTACNLPNDVNNQDGSGGVQTAVAQTVAAEEAQTNQPSPEEGEAQAAPTATGEDQATATSTPDTTDTEEPTPTQEPSETPLPCNAAEFVTDVSIPDGKKFNPGTAFTKTWRLKNVGSCAWTSGYDLVFSGGDAMSGPSAQQLTTDPIEPGETADISVDLTAPASPGVYRANWELRDPSDVVFGIENSSSGNFWVEIEVVEPEAAVERSTTLQRDPAHSKSISVGGASSDTRLGIAPNGDALRAFIDFDLSEAVNLSSSSTINSATLDLTNFSGAGCFEFRHPLKVYQVSYGANPDYPADFNSAPIGTIASASSEAGINSPVDVKSELQSFVSSNGDGHFQIRMELEHDDSGSAFSCMMEWPNPVLNIDYTE